MISKRHGWEKAKIIYSPELSKLCKDRDISDYLEALDKNEEATLRSHEVTDVHITFSDGEQCYFITLHIRDIDNIMDSHTENFFIIK